MHASSISSHLEYVGITERDIQALRTFRPRLDQHADSFVKKFYDHLCEFEGTRAFLVDPQRVQRLLIGQRKYLISLFDAKFDDEYYSFRQHIGQTHFKIGLSFRWYVGAYVQYLDFFIPLFQESFATDPQRVSEITSAFRRATLLDMSIVLEAYHEGDKAALKASQSQIIHQEKLAAVGVLASGLAHEIGNPLASIQAICDNQLRKEPDSAAAVRFQRIRDQVERITGIVRQLVGVSRPIPAVWRPVNLRELIDTSIGLAKLSRNGNSAEIECQLDELLPEVKGAFDQLSQVFMNIFVNAIDALPPTGGLIRISAHEDGNQAIAVNISDSGCGICAEDLSKLFTPFFTTKDVGKGTGLGLHVCKRIVQRHGGEIRVQSTVGKGSEFTVVLPLNKTRDVAI